MNCKCRRYRQCCFVYSHGAFRQPGCDKQRRRKANVYSYVFVHCAVLCVLDTSLFGQENVMREVYTSVAKEKVMCANRKMFRVCCTLFCSNRRRRRRRKKKKKGKKLQLCVGCILFCPNRKCSVYSRTFLCPNRKKGKRDCTHYTKDNNTI